MTFPLPEKFPQSFKIESTPLAAKRFNYSRQIKRTFPSHVE